MKLSSSGVFLPKIFTITLSFFFSSLISSMMPVKVLKGPSITFTLSPMWKGLWFTSPLSAISSTLPRIRFTSLTRMGTGSPPFSAPRKPITLGICFSKWAISPVRSASNST